MVCCSSKVGHTGCIGCEGLLWVERMIWLDRNEVYARWGRSGDKMAALKKVQ